MDGLGGVVSESGECSQDRVEEVRIPVDCGDDGVDCVGIYVRGTVERADVAAELVGDIAPPSLSRLQCVLSDGAADPSQRRSFVTQQGGCLSRGVDA